MTTDPKTQDSRQSTARKLGGLALVLAVIFGIVSQLSGIDLLGMLNALDPAVPIVENVPIDESLPVPIGIYMTAPTGSSDPTTYGGGLDEELARAIRSARQSVDAAAFELNSPAIADALMAAHESGVTVRLVTDNHYGLDVALYERYLAASPAEKDDILFEFEEDPADTLLDELYDAGIPIVDDGRDGLMHNKFVIIDESEIWTGSLNLTVSGSYRNNNNLVRIRSARLAENYRAEFNEMFEARRFGPTSPARTPHPLVTLNGILVEVYFAPEDRVIERIIEQLDAAQESVKFMAFSFTENDLGAAVLRRVREDGLHVQGVMETTGSLTEWSELPRFFCAGLDVRQDGNRYILHHKVIILDDRTVILGSFNFSGSATNTNDENLVIIHDPGIAAQVLVEFERRFAEGRPPAAGGIDCGLF